MQMLYLVLAVTTLVTAEMEADPEANVKMYFDMVCGVGPVSVCWYFFSAFMPLYYIVLLFIHTASTHALEAGWMPKCVSPESCCYFCQPNSGRQ